MGLGSEFMWDYRVLVVKEEGREDDDEMERASKIQSSPTLH